MRAFLRKKDSEAQRGSERLERLREGSERLREASVMSSFLSLLFTSLLALFFYAHCSTQITPCDGDPTADPEFDCLPLPPELSEPEYDGGDYKIPLSGIDGLDEYELQELCFGEYVNEDDLQWDSAPTQDISASASHIDVASAEPLCYYRLRSCNQYGCGRWSNVIKILKGLVPPGSFRLSDSRPQSSRGAYVLEDFTVGFVWDAVTSADPSASNGVVVDRYEFGKEDADASVPDDGWEDMGFSVAHSLTEASSYGKSYGYQIRTCGYVIETSGESPEVTCGAGASLDVEIRLPLPSSHPEVNGGEDTTYVGYDVTWSGVTGAGGYELRERLGSGAWTSIPNDKIDDDLGSYESGRKPQGAYSYRVRACTVEDTNGMAEDDIRCSHGWKEGSNSVLVQVIQAVGVLTGPGLVHHETSYVIGWDEGSIDGAQVYILKETSEGVERTVNTAAHGDTPSVELTGREYGKTYSYLLTACAGEGGEDDYSCRVLDESNPLRVEVKPATLAGLANGGEDNSTDGTYALSWTAASAGSGSSYKIEERSKALGGSFSGWLVLSSENTNSYSIDKPGSDFERDYEYRVSLCASNGVCGEPSAAVALSLRFAKPSLSVDGTIKASGEYSLGWSDVPKAASYVVQELEKTGSACPSSPAAQAGWSARDEEYTPSSSERDISGKAPGKSYCHIAKACNGGGVCGSWSAVYEAQVPDLEWPTGAVLSSDQTDEEDNEYTISFPDVSVAGVNRYELISWASDLGEAGAEPNWGSADVISDTNGDGSLSDDERDKGIGPVDYRKSYHYRAKACAGSNCTGPSPVFTVHVSYSQPALSLTGDVPKGDYTLSWSASSLAPQYVLQKREKRSSAANYGAWGVIGDYAGNSDDSYNAAGEAKADSDYEYRLGACLRASSEAGFNFDKDCTASDAVSASVPKPTLTFHPGSISLDGTDPSGKSSYTLDWGDHGSTESLKSVDFYELQEHTGVIPPGGSFSANSTHPHRPAEGLKAITGKEHGPAYSYRVRACADYNSDGEGDDE